MIIRELKQDKDSEWLRMRKALWPECSELSHKEDMAAIIKGESIINEINWIVLIVVRPNNKLGGFIEASIRPHDDDCVTEPVGYIEGWYVDPDLRNKGLGKRLIHDAEKWALAQGCNEMASDAQIDNDVSIKVHKALGYIETSRGAEVKFKKVLSVF